MFISHITKILLILGLAVSLHSLAQTEPAAASETSSSQIESNSELAKKTDNSTAKNQAQKPKAESAKSEKTAAEPAKTPAANSSDAKSEKTYEAKTLPEKSSDAKSEKTEAAKTQAANSSDTKSEAQNAVCRDKECLSQKLANAKTTKDKAEIFAAYCENASDARERESVCLQIGVLFLSGNEKEAIAVDAKRAVKLLATACNGKEENILAQSCTVLAQIYSQGVEGIAANSEQASKYLSQGCKLHQVSACNKLADKLNYQGRLQEADRIYRENLASFIKVCEQGGYEYCYLVGNIYAKGMGLAKNPAKAVAFYEQACNSKEKASAGFCYGVAEKFADKELELQNQAKAEKFYRIACDLGETVACNKLPDAK